MHNEVNKLTYTCVEKRIGTINFREKTLKRTVERQHASAVYFYDLLGNIFNHIKFLCNFVEKW